MNPEEHGRGEKPLRMQKEKQNGRDDCQSKSREPITVFCRVRPLPQAGAVSARVISPNVVRLTSHCRNKEMMYTFKQVFDEKTSQKSLFDTIALPLVTDLLNGKNGLLFTYGVTGSGKTYTMTGSESNAGVMPRCLDLIFNSIKDHQADKFLFKPDQMNGFEVQSEARAISDERKIRAKLNVEMPERLKKTRSEPDLQSIEPTTIQLPEGFMYSIFVTHVEVYNNTVYDLLEDDVNDRRLPKKKITRKDAGNNVYVHCVTEVEVTSTEEAFDIFLKGHKKKRIAQTVLNAESSRSHSVFTVRALQAPDNFGKSAKSRTVNIGQLSLVDLAGSERTNRTGNTGARLRESGNINNSLMTLRVCLELLRENQTTGSNKMIPYREAKITHLFKSFFEGDGRVAMIVCINPSEADLDENLHVLKFAEMSQEVQVAAPITQCYTMETRSGDTKSATDASPKRKKDIPQNFLQELQSFPECSTLPELINFLEAGVNQLNEQIAASKMKGKMLEDKINSFFNCFRNLESENRYLKNILKAGQQEKLLMESSERVLQAENSALKCKLEDKENIMENLSRGLVEEDSASSLKSQKIEGSRILSTGALNEGWQASAASVSPSANVFGSSRIYPQNPSAPFSPLTPQLGFCRRKLLKESSERGLQRENRALKRKLENKENIMENLSRGLVDGASSLKSQKLEENRILSAEALNRGWQASAASVSPSANVFGSSRIYPQNPSAAISPLIAQLGFYRRLQMMPRRSKSVEGVKREQSPQM